MATGEIWWAKERGRTISRVEVDHEFYGFCWKTQNINILL